MSWPGQVLPLALGHARYPTPKIQSPSPLNEEGAIKLNNTSFFRKVSINGIKVAIFGTVTVVAAK